MKQADLGLNLTTKRTPKRQFLDEMNSVVPWAALVELIAPHAPEGRKGRPPFPVESSNHWHQGMKAHIGVDADSGLVHTVRGTTGNGNDVVEANSLLHSLEAEAFGDAGYQEADKRPDARAGKRWNIAMRPGTRAALEKTERIDQLTD